MLFATLDPTMRKVVLPSGRTAILSDTVGFISDLPTDLIAAFRATLEEVRSAQVLVHVRDIAALDTDVEKADVEKVLGSLDIAPDTVVMEAWNKVDTMPADIRAATEQRAALIRSGEEDVDAFAISAMEGTGFDPLLTAIDEALARFRVEANVEISAGDGAAMAWLHENGDVLDDLTDREAGDGTSVLLTVALDPTDWKRFEQRFGYKALS